jgi:hypothetical protein
VQAPSAIGHAAQKPPPRAFGNNPRRIISALIGPGGHATDQPRMKPLRRSGHDMRQHFCRTVECLQHFRGRPR